MMRIVSTTTKKDLIAFNKMHTNRSVPNRIIRFVLLLFIIVMLWRHSLLLSPNLAGVITAVIVSLFAIFLFWLFKRFLFPLLVSLMLQRKSNPHMDIPVETIIDEQGIHRSSELAQSSIAWGGIQRVFNNDDYLFLYTGTASAFVYGRESVNEGDFDAFSQKAQELFESNRNPKE